VLTTRATTVLWDIDGTLVHSGGVAAQDFLDAVAEVTGTRPTSGRRDYGGRLDTEIAEMLLTAVGAELTLVPEVLLALRRLVAGRLAELRAHTGVYPGVDALLAKLAGAGVRQTVVTGNLTDITGRPVPGQPAHPACVGLPRCRSGGLSAGFLGLGRDSQQNWQTV
jgi:phosphoglycolate phosphatase